MALFKKISFSQTISKNLLLDSLKIIFSKKTAKKKTIKFEDFSYSKLFKKEFKIEDLIESLILSKFIAMVFIFLVIIESSDAVAFSAL